MTLDTHTTTATASGSKADARETDGKRRLRSGTGMPYDGKESNTATTLHDMHHRDLDMIHTYAQRTNREDAERLVELDNDLSCSKKADFFEMTYLDHIVNYAKQCEHRTLRNKRAQHLGQCEYSSYFQNVGGILHQYYCNIDSISTGDDHSRKKPLNRSMHGSAKTTATSTGNHRRAARSGSASSIEPSVMSFLGQAKAASSSDDAKDGSDHGAAAAAESGGVNAGVQGKNGGDPSGDSDESDCDSDSNDDENDSDLTDPYVSRDVLLQQYRARTNNDTPLTSFGRNNVHVDVIQHPCPTCGTERTIIMSEASTICLQCARVDRLVIDSNKPSYKDPPRDSSSYYSYKRINHFNEWLAQFQAKETTEIPDDVYGWILLELKKERRHNQQNISTAKMKSILKKLKLNKYYEHIPHITNRLNGQVAPIMSRATEDKLRNMFKEYKLHL